MSEARPNLPKRSWFAVWRWKWWMWGVVAAIQFGFASYVLSEAPLTYVSNHTTYHGLMRGKWFLFAPCDWLYDNTPLHYPLLKWAEFWGVGFELEGMSLERRGFGCKQIDYNSWADEEPPE